MSKKNKAGLVLLAGVLTFGAVGALASCGEKTPTEPEKPNPDKPNPDKPEEGKIKALTISNKEALTAEWRLQDDDRDIKLTTDPADLNISEAIDNGDIVVTSSNPEVVAAFNLRLKAMGEGEATITVTAGKITDTVKITVLPKLVIEAKKINEIVEEVFPIIQTADKNTTPEKYAIEGVIVATDNKENSVIYDGESFINTYAMTGEKENAVGRVVKAEAQLTHYYSAIQLKKGTYETIDKEIALPEYKVVDEARLKELIKIQADWDLATSKASDRYPTEYAKIAGVYNGDDNLLVNDIKIRTDKSNPTVAAEIAKLGVGDEVEFTGALIGYNSKYGSFNLVPTGVKVTKKAINPTKVNFALPTTAKTFERVDLEKLVTFEPADAKAPIDYEIVDEKGILTSKRTEIMATTEGTYTITAVAHKGVKDLEVKSEPVTVTVAGAADNFFTKATTKTIAEFNAIEGADETNLYKVTGTLASIDTTGDHKTSGKIKLVDGENALEPWSISASLLDFYEKDGKIAFWNSKNFLEEIVDKKVAAVGDKVEILIKHGQYNGKNSFDSVFLRTVEKVTPVEPETPETPTLEGTVVANYDLTTIEPAEYPNNYINTDEELKAAFTNTITEGAINFTTIAKSSKGLEKGNDTQGPKIRGLKLNSKTDAIASITFTFAENVKIDKLHLVGCPWISSSKGTEGFTLDINGQKYVYAADANCKDKAPVLDIIIDLKGANTIKIQMDAAGSKNRAVFTGLQFINVTK